MTKEIPRVPVADSEGIVTTENIGYQNKYRCLHESRRSYQRAEKSAFWGNLQRW